MEASSSSMIKINGGKQSLPRTTSLDTVPKRQDENQYMDPDELFTRKTISEVKLVQIQLRSVAKSFTTWDTNTYFNPGPMQTLSKKSYGSWLGALYTPLCLGDVLIMYVKRTISRLASSFDVNHIHCTILQARHTSSG